MAREKTRAEFELEAIQHRQPPSYPLNSMGADRVQALVRVLKLPETLERRVQDGTLVFGEVGDFKPDARTFPLDQENFVVALTSGMMDFLYAVGRAMSGASVMWSHGTPDNERLLSPKEIADLTAHVFKQWRKHCQPRLWDLFWRNKRINHATFQLSERAQHRTEALVSSAELFMLAHELGHAALNLRLVRPDIENEESRADAVGLALYLPTAQAAVGLRSAFAVRVMCGLTRAGVTFSREHPPAPTRLHGLLEEIRATCPSQQYFDEAATVMVADFELMDVVDDIIDPSGPKNDLAIWQASIRMLAVLLAVASGDNPPAVFVDMFESEARRTPEADMRAIAEKLIRYYPEVPQGTGYISADMRAKMSTELYQCIQAMSASGRALFGMTM